ncbi:MAG: Fumarylpyruvate hydrolase [Alphaproteobacteria bacterium MarineAlpha9_Bin7]|nr:MAG: Fumarylpyruvate hydrolase [Alphaproteobacteria bacterium MarineAlpha9_Bin7]
MSETMYRSDYVISMWDQPSVAVAGGAAYPVRHIYCVGRNYAEHAREMGTDPEREPPFFFMKGADSIASSGAQIKYPSRTQDLHHEVELVVAIGASGTDISVSDASDAIFGYAVGVDLTRRDLQQSMKEKGRPWEIGKSFAQAAPVGEIQPAWNIGHPREGKISLSVNGEVRQEADIKDMTWGVDEVIAELSTYYKLEPGDLVFTGTPAGVSALVRGDKVDCAIDGLESLEFSIANV